MFQKLQGILQSQIPVNFPRCPALVKRIKMNAVHIGIQQFGALAGGVLDAYLLNSVRIGTRTLQRLKQPGRKKVPPESSAMRFMPDRLVTGMIPARIGTLMPASRQRSR